MTIEQAVKKAVTIALPIMGVGIAHFALGTTDRHTEVAKTAVGALTDETRARLAAILKKAAV